MPLTQSNIAHQRLRNQWISTPKLGTSSDVVAWLGAVQAQDYAGAKWALGLRLKGVMDDEVDQAFAAGTILRTHVLRPTWHFVTPADIRWLLALTAPRVHVVNAHMYRKLELTQAVFKRSHAVLTKALQGGQQLTRDELHVFLQKAGLITEGGLRLAYIIMQAELEGLICSGARRGKQFTYALLEERVPPVPALPRELALVELARRYFGSRGPATVQDFSKWSGLTVAEAGNGLEAIRAELQQTSLNGQTYWFAALKPIKRQPIPTAYLLSIYDEYISGYKDRSAIGEAEVGAKLSALGNALSYIIVLDGQIVGTWKRQLKKGAVSLELNPFIRLTKPQQRAIDKAIQHYSQFLGLPVD